MRRIATLAALAAITCATTAHAEPGGCLKYGAVGAVGGHVAGHGVLGAAAGCATGMYKRHEYRKEARAKAALYDKEHPGSKGTYQEKATAYDVEHSTTPGKMNPDAAPAPATQAPADGAQKM
ncbi:MULTISPECIES: hypothetical protein [Komagataeibacter]|uniref:Uncharacterized protein n=1 Tax=Komagataeibacter saccharivorans TaxID=265959 RepID=A0A347WET7_9PROT|nr:hypothetical protein [Komagataeibacter saccharivorans]MBL7237763.1 hypothetical protein [Novacetimonas hansenii]AXY23380.1 hypothetical protein CD178_02633 [Komagataeibacter saccharivorans]PYD50318.1 hypothetical protein CFR79_10285 [Komagataeibacter saccharivorans]QBL92722.1 hypothetical protein KSAC_04760 [Komagataeibacter saccharivorans]GBQ40032.1 hypothetical protein AA0614_1856 [Komagataeibacter saccharivorans NRIC 0614]